MRRAIGLLALLWVLSMMLYGRTLAQPSVPLLDAAAFEDWYYRNPSSVSDVGDPLILRANGAYYCYATSSGRGYRVWKSEDLRDWERQSKHAYTLDFESWSRGNFWAPEVYDYCGRYYMLYSASGEGFSGMRIGVAVSDAPEGPFVDIAPQPLFDPGFSVIDASLFVDDDGQPYLYYARDCSDNVVQGVHESHVYGVRLLADLSGIAGEPVLLLRPDQVWEQHSGPEWLWNEGPVVRKQGGDYWLFYSANFYAGKEYGVGVAKGTSPLGLFVKSEANPLLCYVDAGGETLVSGPGHNSLLDASGESFMVYHTHYHPHAPSDHRQMALDRYGFDADGRPYVNGPTLAPQLRPLADLGFVNLLPMAQGDAAQCLADGDYGMGEAPASFSGIARFAWPEPVMLRALVLYPRPGATGEVSVSLDGVEEIRVDLADAEALPGGNVRLHFEPRSVSKLTIDASGELCELICVGDVPG